MSKETKAVAPETQQTETPKEEVKVEETKQNTFTQEQLDNIIKSRLEAEKNKYEKKLQDEEKQKAELLKEQQLKEAKSKSEIEKIMQERIKEKVDNSILSIASSNNAINPSQVVALLKDEVKYNDDGRIEVVDNNSNVRYNKSGKPFSLEDRVKEFLDSNPHFRKGSMSGSGSQSAIGGKTVKPFNLQDYDHSNPEDRKAYAEYRKKRDSGAIQINLNK